MLTAFETDTRQVETDIPLITEEDYGKPLLLVHLKAELGRTHFFEAIHPVKRIVCKGHKCPLCDAKIDRDTERLLPVYSIEDEVVKILRVPLGIYPFSLYSGMRSFIAGTAWDWGSFYITPFVIFFKGYTEGRIGAYGLEQDALFEIQSEDPLQHEEQIAAKDNCVARFLEDYKPGDLTKSANIHVSKRAMKMSLKNNPAKNEQLADIADFLDSMPDFEVRTKRVGKLF
jgi:hypothetical protein